eukprot:TRINITY_DN81047_c0_g1_i1.p1 TRINITY_DN81047_c0_g1~~TRINITY_DN81047_c0_g1_i1.p1  ORF type:complete len:934 (-),score=101.50 TRINITY_DN81047_c0_g1_i1:86-2887(-)
MAVAPPLADVSWLEKTFSSIAVFFRFWLLYLPDVVLAVPHSPAFVRFTFTYVFFQALGLLWAFTAVGFQSLSRRLVEWVLALEHEVGSAKALSAEPSSPFSALLEFAWRCYVTFCTLRFGFLIGWGLWTLGWQAQSDFPTVKRLLLDPSGKRGSVRVALAAPIGMIALSFVCLGTVPGFCKSQPEVCGSGWFIDSLVDEDGRVNRMLRLCLVVMIAQWGQIVESLLPNGVPGLARGAPVAFQVVPLFLIPASLGRLLHFAGQPTNYVQDGHAINAFLPFVQVTYHCGDNMLAASWAAWCTLAVLVAPTKNFRIVPSERFETGLRRKSCNDIASLEQSFERTTSRDIFEEVNQDWSVANIRVKYTAVATALAYFLRSCLSPRIGWTFAQMDIMALCLLYPLLCAVVWSGTFFVVSVRGARMPWLTSCAGVIAVLAAGTRPSVPKMLAFVHISKQVLKLITGRDVRYAVDPQKKPGGERAERRWARTVVFCYGSVLASWFILLSALAWMAAMQQRFDFFPSQMEHVSDVTPSGKTLKVGHHAVIGNSIVLKSAAQPSTTWWGRRAAAWEGEQTYGICRQSWSGLGILDYAFLSLLAYWDAGDPELPKIMADLFPRDSGVEMFIVNGSKRNTQTGRDVQWIEFRARDLDARIIAVRGTDPTNLGHVLEDIRMWTEPVLLRMLTVVFPTINIWTGALVDTWLYTTHSLLRSLELDVGPWTYESLLEHVRTTYDEAEGSPPLIFTGHSLGGGIAQVAAARSGSSVVAISPPGLLQSFMKHWRGDSMESVAKNATSHAAHRRSVSLVVDGDWVSKFDGHPGFVQTIACDREDLALFGSCHLVESTICHLVKACGDPRGRWRQCEHSFDPHKEAWEIAQAAPARLLATGTEWFGEVSLSQSWQSLSAGFGLLAMAGLLITGELKALGYAIWPPAEQPYIQ